MEIKKQSNPLPNGKRPEPPPAPPKKRWLGIDCAFNADKSVIISMTPEEYNKLYLGDYVCE